MVENTTTLNSTQVVAPFRWVQQKQVNSAIYIGFNWLSQHLPSLLKNHTSKAQKVLLVSEEKIASLYGNTLKKVLEQAGYKITLFLIEGNEAAKTLQTVEKIYAELLTEQFTRNDVCVALGGGIVGDITGYAAATYRRGMQFVQCPTTLLAQVDASVGGKTGVNIQGYKNMVGAFYPPQFVAMEVQFLASLPADEFACGMAEVIKTALIQNSVPYGNTQPDLLSLLKNATPNTQGQYENEQLVQWIKICCELKANVVEADPEETQAVRELLNLGHTFGHAYEKWFAGSLKHGQAVAYGLTDAVQVAQKLGTLPDKAALDTLLLLLDKFNLKHQPKTPVPINDLLQLMQQDKKRQLEGSYRLILPYKELGQVEIKELSAEEIKVALTK